MDSPDHCIQFSTVNNDAKEHRRNALRLQYRVHKAPVSSDRQYLL